jgi:hypothetical protein
MSGEHLCQRRFAGTVWSHDGVNLAFVDCEVDAFEYFLAVNPRVQISNL